MSLSGIFGRAVAVMFISATSTAPAPLVVSIPTSAFSMSSPVMSTLPAFATIQPTSSVGYGVNRIWRRT